MFSKLLVASTLLGLVAQASAQCSLSVTGSGAPGSTLAFALDGSTAGAFCFLAIGETQGTTTINLGPLGTLTLGLAFPFAPVPIGVANAQGDVSFSLNVPSGLTTGIDLFGQGITLGISMPGPGGGGPPSLSFCTTNVVSFHVGP